MDPRPQITVSLAHRVFKTFVEKNAKCDYKQYDNNNCFYYIDIKICRNRH